MVVACGLSSINNPHDAPSSHVYIVAWALDKKSVRERELEKRDENHKTAQGKAVNNKRRIAGEKKEENSGDA